MFLSLRTGFVLSSFLKRGWKICMNWKKKPWLWQFEGSGQHSRGGSSRMGQWELYCRTLIICTDTLNQDTLKLWGTEQNLAAEKLREGGENKSPEFGWRGEDKKLCKGPVSGYTPKPDLGSRMRRKMKFVLTHTIPIFPSALWGEFVSLFSGWTQSNCSICVSTSRTSKWVMPGEKMSKLIPKRGSCCTDF